jgi:trans-aconitate methyltransferase
VRAEPASPGREWNADVYHRVSDPQFEWGLKVLNRLKLRGDETVLDAGCGTGRLTAELLRRLPHGRVVALDVSRNMLRTAEEYLKAEFGGRVTFLAADIGNLLAEQPTLANTFDGIFSTATFHWVLDHEQLFRNLFWALRPGGWVHAQCGGGANLARLLQRFEALATGGKFRPFLAAAANPWTYANDTETAERLRRAGFRDVATSLEPAPAQFDSAQAFREFIESVILRSYLPLLPEEQMRRELLDELTSLAARDQPAFVLDYWRLNLRADRARDVH